MDSGELKTSKAEKQVFDGTSLSNLLNEAKELFLNKESADFEYLLEFFQKALNIIDDFNFLNMKFKKLLVKQVEIIKKLSSNKKITFPQLQIQLKKVLEQLEKISDEVNKNQTITSNFYCFFYSRARSRGNAYSKVVSFNIFSRDEETICKGNRFKNASISCRINQNLLFIYLKSKESGPLLVNLSEKITNPELRKDHVPLSKYDHYQSAFVQLKDDEIGFFASEERKCESFNVRLKSWKNLSDFPRESKNPTGAFFNEKVFIIDFSSKIITTYSQSDDVFESTDSSTLKENTQKLIFVANDELLVYQDKSLLKYEGMDFVCVKTYPKVIKYERIIAFPIVHGTLVYFLTNHRKVISLEV